jgi:hypothetical protein
MTLMGGHRLSKWLCVLAAVAGVIYLFRDQPMAQAQTPSHSLTFSTYLGGLNEDNIRDVAADSQGNIYIAGETQSSNFTVTANAYDSTFNGAYDAFVMKLDPNGNLLWSTFLGGPNYDAALALEVDSQGYVYVTGYSGIGFPVTPGAFRTTFYGVDEDIYGIQDRFVAKLKPDGSGLVFASYTGGRDLAVDQNGDIYIATSHKASDPPGRYPVQWFVNPLQSTVRGPEDSIVVKVKSDGTRVLWATYFGGSGIEGGTPSIRVSADGSPYILTGTNSTDLPTTAGAYDRTFNGVWDLYLAKFSPNGSSLVFSTYLGGSQNEFTETHGLALDSQGNAYVAITTTSPDFPTTSGAFQRTYGGAGTAGTGAGTNYPGDGLVAKISADGSRLLASTYIGGRYGEGIEGVGLDAQGNAYVSGATYSSNFPVTSDAFQAGNRGDSDFFAAKLSSDLSQLLYSTYFGGTDTDLGRTATVDAHDNFVIAGMTRSNDLPTKNASQATRGGGDDAMLAKFGFAQVPRDVTPPQAPTGLILSGQ